MTKATLMFNYYELKNLYLNKDLDYNNFKNDNLIEFCKIGKKIIKEKEKKETDILKEISDYCLTCPSKDCCPEEECIMYRIEAKINAKS